MPTLQISEEIKNEILHLKNNPSQKRSDKLSGKKLKTRDTPWALDCWRSIIDWDLGEKK